MADPLETAANPTSLKRVVIEPVSRVEGHGKVTLLLDDAGLVKQARFHIVEFRGFEKFVQGRPYWEIAAMVQRLCGICPVSHQLAAAKAVDVLVGARQLTPTADKLRRLAHNGQVLQSHALHFFYLASPDLLFGFDAPPEQRNVFAVLEARPDQALKGIKLRKYGQEVLRVLTGKRIHGIFAIPGGVNKALAAAERELLLAEIDAIVGWAEEGLALARTLFLADRERNERFASYRSSHLSLCAADGAFDLYDGGLRARDERGATIFDHADYAHYDRLLREEVKSWSYMKFPFIVSRGVDDGWYRVGPLARVNNADFIRTPRAEAARRDFAAYGEGQPVQPTLAYHWARMIEMLAAAEAIRELLLDPDIVGTDLVTRGERASEGVGVIEAPRGTLFHHYRVADDDTVVKANLIVSTTSNNTAMNRAIREVAASTFDGRAITEGMLNRIEVAVRAFDPCLSCATHAIGRMPLEVEALDAEGRRVDRLARHGDGRFERR